MRIFPVFRAKAAGFASRGKTSARRYSPLLVKKKGGMFNAPVPRVPRWYLAFHAVVEMFCPHDVQRRPFRAALSSEEPRAKRPIRTSQLREAFTMLPSSSPMFLFQSADVPSSLVWWDTVLPSLPVDSGAPTRIIYSGNPQPRPNYS